MFGFISSRQCSMVSISLVVSVCLNIILKLCVQFKLHLGM